MSGYLGDKFGQRIFTSLFFLLLAMLGVILIIALPTSNPVGRLIGYYLTQASPAPFVAILSLISSNIAGYTKKTTCAAMYLIAYCVGNIIGMQATFDMLFFGFECPNTFFRTSDIPAQGRSRLSSGRNRDPRLLGTVHLRLGVHLVVLSPTK